MGKVKLKIRELAAERGWTLKQVAEQAGVNYNTVKSYARTPNMNMADLETLYKLAQAFGIAMEDLMELVEE
ncbi:MAG: helix-turn-helix transcriptional regulator [Leptolyngbya sp. SIO4C5]|nr:helix-turn-helix transcriptional regulator [Leptolyngbya sp. SIO4C5]